MILLINLLIGFSWAISIIGSFFVYFLLSDISFFISLISLLLGAIPGLILVVFFEIALIEIKKFEELKYQSQILENIHKKLK